MENNYSTILPTFLEFRTYFIPSLYKLKNYSYTKYALMQLNTKSFRLKIIKVYLILLTKIGDY